MTLVIAFVGESGAVMAGDMREITFLGDPAAMEVLERGFIPGPSGQMSLSWRGPGYSGYGWAYGMTRSRLRRGTGFSWGRSPPLREVFSAGGGCMPQAGPMPLSIPETASLYRGDEGAPAISWCSGTRRQKPSQTGASGRGLRTAVSGMRWRSLPGPWNRHPQ